MENLFLKSSERDLYKDLNTSQRSAVKTFKGPVLVWAGAGSGKTRVLVYRITALVLEGISSWDNILAVTFTNKAAREMKERALNLLSFYGKSIGWTPWIGTFHSVCAQILRQNTHLLHGRKSVNIYDQADQLKLIKKVLRDLNIDSKIKDPKNLRSQINLCKRMGLAPHEISSQPHLFYDQQFELIYQNYEKALKRADAFDFESLLLETYRLMLRWPDFLKSLQNQFQYICVDEYQDTNHIQYLLIKKLAEKHRNICVVGDEDQSIYSWRGADINNIMDFEKDFQPCSTFFLEENYRSTQNIVQGANGLISHNRIRKGKSLRTQKKPGRKIHICEALSDYEEGRFVSESIRSFCAGNENNYGDFTVLYRTNAQSRMIEDHLRAEGVPYKIVGGLRFYERKEVKDLLSYMKLVLNSNDDVSFLSIVNSPRRGIGPRFLSRLQEEVSRERKSLYNCLKEQARQGRIQGKSLLEIDNFIRCIEEAKSEKAKGATLHDIYSLILDRSGYVEALQAHRSMESQSRIENLQELGHLIEQKEEHSEGSIALEDFLEEMSLLAQEDKTREEQDCVTLMTLHNSKGLEFNSVFITGMEENLFPSFQSVEDNNLEEERRLAYVGMTRAKERLTLSYAKRRKLWGRDQYNAPSRFLSEIPKELIRWEALPLTF